MHEEGVEIISCPFCPWRYAGLAGGTRHRQVFDEHLASAHGDVPPEDRRHRVVEHERRGLLVAPLAPLAPH